MVGTLGDGDHISPHQVGKFRFGESTLEALDELGSIQHAAPAKLTAQERREVFRHLVFEHVAIEAIEPNQHFLLRLHDVGECCLRAALRVGEFPHDAGESVEVSPIDEVVVGLDHDMRQKISLLLGKALEQSMAKLRDGGHRAFLLRRIVRHRGKSGRMSST